MAHDEEDDDGRIIIYKSYMRRANGQRHLNPEKQKHREAHIHSHTHTHNTQPERHTKTTIRIRKVILPEIATHQEEPG